jgi:N-carbamoyl-L-amino-acid hydrolase
MVVDLRNPGAEALARMLAAVREAVAASADERGCQVDEEPVWRIEPLDFDEELVALARGACERVTGTGYALPSGALHDAASMAPLMPTVMVFSPSIAGISHAAVEDTSEDDLRTAIEVFGTTVNDWITTAS